MKLPIAMPPKNPVRIVETACVVLPNTRTSWRDQTTSYISPAAPDRTKMARINRGCRIGGVSHGWLPRRLARTHSNVIIRPSKVVRPVDPAEADDDAEDDKQ